MLDWLRLARHQAVDSYLPDSETVRDSCLDDVVGCDLYVLIAGHRYGFRPPDGNPEGLSITHLEFRRAGECGIPRVALLRTSIPDVRTSDLQDPALAPLVLAFRDEVASQVRPAEFSDLRGLIQGLSTGIQGELAKLEGRPGGPAGPGVAPRPVSRSSYVQQVRRIAPPDPPGLLGREAELAELAGFCLEDGRGPYAWWQAGPWAGKSALLSTFVLRPPPEVRERVRIVSFFITARLAAQDTREAFTQVLLEQLAELTGQELPPVLPEATREAYLLDLLAQAAAACQQAGGRLVLVVDGLDEDRGVTTGPHAHSIAGLLPADPPAGMRVIVAGRPNPPVPDDVPDWHPLRDREIIRPLPASPYARDIGGWVGRNCSGCWAAARPSRTCWAC